MKKIISFLVVLIFVIGCSNKNSTTINYEKITNDEGKQSILNNNLVFDKFQIKNIKDFEIYFIHFLDGKEIRKYDLIHDENKDESINLDVMYSISNSQDSEQKKIISFMEGASVYYDNIILKSKTKDIKTLKIDNIELSNKDLNILGGFYLDNKNNINNPMEFKDMTKDEALLLVLKLK
ncbi:hypothetical protein [Mycoplasma sp. P36-A1]|uniref:hypothetical protein n=1 Tax=Mycoplasma sp. P36-A1 TaxID=3252900 RepID=UPI003C2CAE04